MVSGIMFSRNMSNSVARNNYVYNETNCIFVSQSHNNEIYYNRLVGRDDAIHLFHKSSNNVVHNNSITDSGNPVSSRLCKGFYIPKQSLLELSHFFK